MAEVAHSRICPPPPKVSWRFGSAVTAEHRSQSGPGRVSTSASGRRCLAIPYELKFAEKATEPHHRLLREEVKEDEWLLPRVPGFWLWIRDIHQVFFLEEGATKLKHVPQKVVVSTADFLSAECAAALRDWLDENMVVAQDNKDAIQESSPNQ